MPSDLVIVFHEIAHDKFKRNMHDLVLDYKVTLAEALKGGAIHVVTIENEKIEVAVDRIMTPDSFKVIEGKGMPIANNDPLGPIKQNYRRGNLIVRFDIEFPTHLDSSKKE